jgi:hypothetical protein
MRAASGKGVGNQRSTTYRAFAAGLLTGKEDARIETAMAISAKAYADLGEVKPFWR